MASIVIMPKQGLMMEEGVLTQWLKNEGDQVTAGEPLFEMETDKLTITMDAEVSGTLLKIIHPAGDTVPITKPIAIVGEPGEDISALLGEEAGAAPAEEAAPAEAAAEGGLYVPGTYTAEATGMGVVTVNVTVDANAITAVEIDGPGETPGIGLAAIDPLGEQVMAAQSAEIDGVTGATLTSTAVRTAVAAALAEAAA